MLEAESKGGGRRTVSAFRPRPLRYLPSLDASLMARLDRLGPAKEIAQAVLRSGGVFLRGPGRGRRPAGFGTAI